MLLLDVRSLAHNAAVVSGELPPSDPVWQGVDASPVTPVKVSGRVSSAGVGHFYWNGHLEDEVQMSCSRCLEPVNISVSEDVRVLFAEEGTEGSDDPDVYSFERGAAMLDLTPAAREHWLLAVPRFALCSEDCKGLCPQCGENLNEVTCTCVPASDSRWDALRKMK